MGHPAPGPLSPYRLSGLVSSMVVWALHFVTIYSLQGLACAEDVLRAPLAGRDQAFWVLMALTVLALLAIAWIGLRGLAAWRATAPARGPAVGKAPVESADAGIRRRHFTAAVTALLALMSAIGVVFTAIPILLLPTCA